MELPTSHWTPMAAFTSSESSTFMLIISHLPVGILGMEDAQKGLLDFDSDPNRYFMKFVPLTPHTQLYLAPKNSQAMPW